jgi:transcriptional regulator with XRE-family HTH domain
MLPAMMADRIKRIARRVLAENLRRVRAARGLSQEGLADAAGLHRTYIGSVERCEVNISLDNIERLARAVGMDVAELLRRRE